MNATLDVEHDLYASVPVTQVQTDLDQDLHSTIAQIDIAQEIPIALIYNGISHAVLMATPQHLIELAYGFSLSEGIIHSAQQIYEVYTRQTTLGIEVHIELAARCFESLKLKRRMLIGRTGCGLCGVEALQQAIPDLPHIQHNFNMSSLQILAGFRALNAQQSLNLQTGGCHAAALWQGENQDLIIFEDVGRHNALDKLIGWRLLNQNPIGAVLLTSRLSYELVQKAANAQLPLLAAISAPTVLAVRLAQQIGLQLAVFAREDRVTWLTP